MIRVPTATALALFATTVSAQGLPTGWELALPNAKFLGGLDLRRVRESPIARPFESQLAGEVLQNGGITVRIPGIDRLNDLVKETDRLFVSSTAAGSAVASNFLGALEGSFQPVQLQPLLQGQSTIYRGIGVYRLSTSGDLSVATDGACHSVWRREIDLWRPGSLGPSCSGHTQRGPGPRRGANLHA